MAIAGVCNFPYQLAVLFAIFFFFFLSLFTVVLGFVLALLDYFLDFFFFFLSVLVGEGFVVFGDQALDLLAVDLHDLGSFRFSVFYLTFAVEFVLFFALDVGVVALAFVVFHVICGSVANEFADLVLGKRRSGVWLCL